MSSSRTPRHALEAPDPSSRASADAAVADQPVPEPAVEVAGPVPDAPAGDADDAALPEGERRAARSTAIMAVGTLLSRVLGFVRAALLTVAIGATALVADVFQAANSLPNVVYMLLVGGVFNVVLVPQLIKHAKDDDGGADYTSRLMTLSVLVMAAFTVAATLAAAPIMAAITSGWSPGMLRLGTVFALWTMPQVFFYGMYALLGQVLNANGRFGAYMWAPVLNNVVSIAAIVLYLVMFGSYAGADRLDEWTSTQTLVLAGGHTLGVVLQAVILFVPLRRLGLRLRPTFGWRGIGLREAGRIAAYTLATGVVSNIALLMTQRFISAATEARHSLVERVPGTEGWDAAMAQAAIPGLQAYNTGMLIAVLPHSVFALSLATVLFNRLARSMGEGDLSSVHSTTASGLRAFTVPLMFSFAGVVVLAGPLGRIFGSNAGTALPAGVAVGQILLLLALSIPFRSASFYLLRVFYAAEDAKVPMVVQISASLVMLAISWAGSFFLPAWSMGFWVALAASVAFVYQFVLAHILTVRRFGDYGVVSVMTAHLQTGAAALAAGLVGAAAVWLLGGYTGGWAWASITTALLTCVVAAAVMAPVYLVALRLMRLPELEDSLRPLVRRVPALGRVLGVRASSAT